MVLCAAIRRRVDRCKLAQVPPVLQPFFAGRATMIRVAGIPLLLNLLTLALGVLAAFPDPLKLSGSVLIHDPSLVQRASDGKYFLFTTHTKGGILTATNLAGYVFIYP